MKNVVMINFFTFLEKNLDIFYLVNIMETFGDKFPPFSAVKFCCKICDYVTSHRSHYEEHLSTGKHKKVTLGDILVTDFPPFRQDHIFVCDHCSKQYKSRNGLWKHKKNCNVKEETDIINSETTLSDKDLIKILIEQNHKLMDMIQTGTNNNITTTTTTNSNNNSNNKTFNLQFYLNETCKNAMNISDFVELVKPQLSDLENTGRVGYVEGVSKIILNNLKNIVSQERPFHCSDYKREIIYIKDNDKWTKEEPDKPILTKAIKIIANENIKNISKWRNEHPNCTKADSKNNNLYLKIVSNSMSGSTLEETNKNINKIINNVAKQVIIDKSMCKI